MKDRIKSFVFLIIIFSIAFLLSEKVEPVTAIDDDFYYRETLNFSYTGAVQGFTTEYYGYYEFEVWGAEGGGVRTSGNTAQGYAGLGGYSKGAVELPAGTNIYVQVGGLGSTAGSGLAAGGYNGGGAAFGSDNGEPGGGGGGASDIRIDVNSLYNRIIVAGGGGGGGEDGGDAYGHGGGSSGTGSYPGTQNSSSSGAVFGYGANTPYDGGGGGGGWYGGGTTGGSQTIPTSNSGTDAQGGSGGSGFVYTESTQQYVPSGYALTPDMWLENAATYNGTQSFPNTLGTANETGHQGNGYVKIKCYQLCEGNSELSKIVINDEVKDLESGVYEYNFTISPETTLINVSALAVEGCSTIEGNAIGAIFIPVGTTTKNIVVTSKTGEISTYTINFIRQVSTDTRLTQITINGTPIENFSSNTLNYNVSLQYYEDEIEIETTTKAGNATVTGDGIHSIRENDKSIEIVVTSESGNETRTYTISLHRTASTYLKSLSEGKMHFDDFFSPTKTSYGVLNIGRIQTSYLSYEPYDLDATITTEGSLEEGLMKITVSKTGLTSTTYTLTLKNTLEYSAKKTVQTFKAPFTGKYRLHVWGAQGQRG